MANDFKKLFRRYPEIVKVDLSGRKAEKLLSRLVVRNQELPDLVCVYAPYTSPAKTRLVFEAKLLAWKAELK